MVLCAFALSGADWAVQHGAGVRVCRSQRAMHSRVRMGDEQDFGETPEASKQTMESIVDEEKEKKKKEIERLRAAEKFMEIDEGAVECRTCGFTYEPKKGDSMMNIAPGTSFSDLPRDFRCPSCNSPRSYFFSKKKVIAGFAENQQYGFGGNTLTEGQKSGLIFGGLLFFAILFLSGYLLN
mmetsp:Transcript_1723/g.5210  ORF Transcript_1723/g.5210 Transcript_1723/m.5210 type:complete len:181 (+) Transcript_1723:108-650(+)|eukprot:CAMPEP_0198726782 /NCGR_PEP_ID=MMETSP1475-20131203/3724_1 /TAXON_ID= ORGANISM="Unidentified sp., Strain CCMP1999" /NCGR_SAMPLE_ID=MMETSP1475 /ASSEMBLY_ACC=CAM_ASM_001111 /LENGTH=180 /DNA_ID=CAMNT_0044488743 /DNA_START=92 /DNA_END=634 /DNA_ORIENTATION=+